MTYTAAGGNAIPCTLTKIDGAKTYVCGRAGSRDTMEVHVTVNNKSTVSTYQDMEPLGQLRDMGTDVRCAAMPGHIPSTARKLRTYVATVEAPRTALMGPHYPALRLRPLTLNLTLPKTLKTALAEGCCVTVVTTELPNFKVVAVLGTTRLDGA